MTDTRDTIATILSGGVIIALGLILESGFSFLSKIILSRIAGNVGFGAISQGIAVLMILQTISLLGVNKGIASYLPKLSDRIEKENFIATGFLISTIIAVMLSCLAYIKAEYLAEVLFQDETMQRIIEIFAIASPFAVIFQYSIGVTRGMNKVMPKTLIQNIIKPVALILLIVITAFLGDTLYGFAWAYSIPYIIAGVLGFVYVYFISPINLSLNTLPINRKLITFSLPLGLSSSMWFIFSDIDTFLLGYFVTTASVGAYHAAYSLAMLITIILKSIKFLSLPSFSELASDGETHKMRDLYHEASKWMFFGVIPILVLYILFPSRILEYSFGTHTSYASQSLLVLSLGFGFHTIAGPNIEYLTSIKQTRMVMYFTVVAAVANIFLNLFLIPRLGILGAAIGTTGSYILLNIQANIVLYYRHNIFPFNSDYSVIISAVSIYSFVIVYIDSEFISNGPFSTFLMFGIFALGYCIIMYYIGLDQSERRFVMDRLLKP